MRGRFSDGVGVHRRVAHRVEPRLPPASGGAGLSLRARLRFLEQVYFAIVFGHSVFKTLKVYKRGEHFKNIFIGFVQVP